MLLSAALSLASEKKRVAIESSLTPREGTAITAPPDRRIPALCVSLLGEREPLSLRQPGREHLRPHRDRRDRIYLSPSVPASLFRSLTTGWAAWHHRLVALFPQAGAAPCV